MTAVFDKGYCRFDWWRTIHDSQAFFVTRAKVNMRLRKTVSRTVRKRIGDGFRIVADEAVVLASKGDSRLPIPLRRIKVRRDKGGHITLLTNDCRRTAIEIAALYKSRWQIELLFRWIKQHLDIRKFLGANDNAIRLQILAADRLSLAAHRRTIAWRRPAAAPLRRTHPPIPVLTKTHRQDRQTSARQPEQTQTPRLPQPTGVLLWVTFPRTALRAAGRMRS
jgi:hypothetical protein